MKKYDFKKTTYLTDGDGIGFRIEIKILKGNLSICGYAKNYGGQCYDSISPRTKAQKKLIKIWKKYHLNDMHAGTSKQENFIKTHKIADIPPEGGNQLIKAVKCRNPKGGDYDYNVLLLKAGKLWIDKHPETGRDYKYGHGWLTVKLPKNLIKTLTDLCYILALEEK